MPLTVLTYNTLFAYRDAEFATELSQAILVSHLDLIVAVLDFLAIPHEDGFFAKDLDASQYLTDGWQARAYEHFQNTYAPALLLFYLNHLGVELGRGRQLHDILAGMRMVAEGVNTAEGVLALGAQARVELPIAEQMANVLAGRAHPLAATEVLMLRPQKHERH